MKKSCAMKLLAVALVVILTMSTGLSAMAASVTSFTRYDGDTVNVETQVTGLEEESMVTYLVTDNTSLAATTDAKIKAIDQVNVGDDTAVEFGYTTTADAIETDKIYVGADTWDAAKESAKELVVNGAKVKENANEVAVLRANANLVAGANEATAVALYGSSADVAYVLVNGVEVDFAIKDADEIYVFEALDANTVIDVCYNMISLSAVDYIETVCPNGVLNYDENFDYWAHAGAALKVATFTSKQAFLNGNSTGESFQSWFDTTKAYTVNYETTGSVLKAIYADADTFTGKEIKELITLPASKNSYIKDTEALNADIVNAVKAMDAATVAAYAADAEAIIPVTYPAGTELNGIYLGNKANKAEYTINVPVAGEYKVAVHAALYNSPAKDTNEKDLKDEAGNTIYKPVESNRMPVVNGVVTTLMTNELGTIENSGNGAISTAVITLEAGENTIVLNGNGNIARFDAMFIAPNNAKTDAVFADMYNNRKAETMPASLAKAIGNNTYSDVVVSLGKVTKTETSITAFARATGNFSECGIEVGGTQYKALAVGGSENLDTKGAYAIELYSENAEDIAALVGAAIKAYADDVVSEAKNIE